MAEDDNVKIQRLDVTWNGQPVSLELHDDRLIVNHIETGTGKPEQFVITIGSPDPTGLGGRNLLWGQLKPVE